MLFQVNGHISAPCVQKHLLREILCPNINMRIVMNATTSAANAARCLNVYRTFGNTSSRTVRTDPSSVTSVKKGSKLQCVSLPFATTLAERLCFHKRLSFCPQGGGVCGRRAGHCSGRYASYWNAVLFSLYFCFLVFFTPRNEIGARLYFHRRLSFC